MHRLTKLKIRRVDLPIHVLLMVLGERRHDGDDGRWEEFSGKLPENLYQAGTYVQ